MCGVQRVKGKTYQGIDAAKLFFALCIVALHADVAACLPGNAGWLLEKAVFRLAVPYFFVASGFLLGLKTAKTDRLQVGQIIRRYCLRLLLPLIVFSVISDLQRAWELLSEGTSLPDIIRIIGKATLFYPFGALWYVQASIVGALLLYPFLRWGRLAPAVLTGAALYAFALLCNNYFFLAEGTALQAVVDGYMRACLSPRNGLFVGFPFLAIGACCGRIWAWAMANRRMLLPVAALTYAAYVAEVLLLRQYGGTALDDGALYVTHLLTAPALLLLTASASVPLKAETTLLMRSLSTGLYYLHRPILWFLCLVSGAPVVNFLCVLALAVGLCLAAYRTKCSPLCRLLK